VAHYHLDVNVGVKDDSGKLAASSHYAYICREGLFAKLKSEEELVLTGSGNMPAWAAVDPSVFWLASDTYERANGSVYREIEGALPRELPLEAQQAIVQKFIDRVLSKHVHSWGIHVKDASDGGKQPHVHLMWSERVLDDFERAPELFFKRTAAARMRKDGTRAKVDSSKGGCRKENMYERLLEFRALWAELVNQAYAEAGLDLRVDHRSYADQGVDKVPERHLGPVHTKALHDAQQEAEEAEAEALRLVAAVEAKNAVASVLLPTLARPKSKGGHTMAPPLAPSALPPRHIPDEESRFHEFIFRLASPEPGFAPRKPRKPELRQRPWAYEAALPKPSKWRDYRLRIMVRLYGIGSVALADTWFVEQRDNDVVLSRTDGSRLIDKGRRIEAANGNCEEAWAIIELALMKGWSAINFTGTDDFKRVAMAEALAAGIPVHARTAHDMALLASVQRDLEADGGRDADDDKGAGSRSTRQFDTGRLSYKP
jgi:hypothetical protein